MSISCAAFEATVVPPDGADTSHCAKQTTCFQLTLCDNAPIAVSYNLLVIQIPMLVVNLSRRLLTVFTLQQLQADTN